MSNTPNEDTNVPETPIFDPFPKPVTMPSGWDLSEITPDPQPASDENTDESTQS